MCGDDESMQDAEEDSSTFLSVSRLSHLVSFRLSSAEKLPVYSHSLTKRARRKRRERIFFLSAVSQ